MFEFKIWDREIPLENKDINNIENDNINRIVFYPVKSQSKTPVVVIFPGGGYGFRSFNAEGHDVAAFFNLHGISAAVVDYRVAPYRYPCQLLDAQRAIKVIRHKAEQLNIDGEKLFTVGFSAGGHLCGMTATFPDVCNVYGDEIDKQSAKPTGAVLCYPVISSDEEIWHRGSFANLLGEENLPKKDEFSIEKRVDTQTCPCFVWHRAEDDVVPMQNSLRLADALRKQNILCEVYVSATGGHGGGLAQEARHISPWPEMVLTWMKKYF